MVRVKATTSDIHARLAKGECANFHNGRCQGSLVCAVIEGDACDYFTNYVKPLLDYPEFTNKYSREAKITVALNPKAKVIRKRRMNADPNLSFETAVMPAATGSKTAKAAATTVASATRAKTSRPPSVPSTGKQRKTAEPKLSFETSPVPTRMVASKSSASMPRNAKSTAAKAEQPVTTTNVAATHSTPRTPATPSTAVTKKSAIVARDERPITTVVTVAGQVIEKPATGQTKKRTAATKMAVPAAQPQLLLEITPATPQKSTTGKKRR